MNAWYFEMNVREHENHVVDMKMLKYKSSFEILSSAIHNSIPISGIFPVRT